MPATPSSSPQDEKLSSPDFTAVSDDDDSADDDALQCTCHQTGSCAVCVRSTSANALAAESSFTSRSDGTCMGFLSKYSIGRSAFGRSNWKRRYFVLAALGTAIGLGYYKDDTVKVQKGAARLDRVSTRIVSRPSTLTHRKATSIGLDICVIYFDQDEEKEMRLLLRADTKDDHDRWVAALSTVFSQVDLKKDHCC